MKQGRMNGGGMNMAGMLKQAQKMQANIAKLQEELEKREYTSSSGGGMVTVTVTGANTITKLDIKPEVVDPDDIEMLQDLIMTAANEALSVADETSASEMKKITGGVGLPGGLI
ncbi:MAG: YbaB/EbfC family nucleoid-associated protein [Clostridia bacterium]